MSQISELRAELEVVTSETATTADALRDAVLTLRKLTILKAKLQEEDIPATCDNCEQQKTLMQLTALRQLQ